MEKHRKARNAMEEFTNSSDVVVRVVGVGGAGIHIVGRMIDDGVLGLEFIAFDTDPASLAASRAGATIDAAGGAAGDGPEAGRAAAEAHASQIRDALSGSDMVFVVCGEGGGTGTGASPVVADIARQTGALTIAVVTRPFGFEPVRRAQTAQQGIEDLGGHADATVVIADENLDVEGRTVAECFRKADKAVKDTVCGVTGLVTNPNPYLDVDFSDLRRTLQDVGTAVVCLGEAPASTGEAPCLAAARAALGSPLSERGIEGARTVVVSFAGPSDLRLKDVMEAMSLVTDVTPDAAILFGLAANGPKDSGTRATIVAAGFDDEANGQ